MTNSFILNRHSIIIRLLVPTALTIITLGLIATYFVHNRITNTLLKQTYTDTQNTALIFADRMNRRFTTSHSLINNITNLSLIKSYYEQKSPPIQDPQILARLKEENHDQDFSAIYLMDLQGNTLVSTDPTFVGQNYSFRSYFKQAMLGNPTQDIAIGKTSNQLGFYLASPIKINDKIIGVVVGKLKPEPVLRLLSTESFSNLTNTHKIHLVDETGTIIASTDTQMLYTQLTSLDIHPDLKTLAIERYHRSDFLNLKYDSTFNAIQTHQHQTIKSENAPPSNHPHLLSLAPIENTPYHVLLETELDPITNSVAQITQTIVLIILGAAIMAIIIINFILYQTIRPLADLTQAAISVESGRSTTITPLARQDEIGQLSRAFSTMTQKLLDDQRNIEEKVNKRTAELTRLNKSMIGRELKMIELKEQIKKLTSNSKI